VYYFQICPKDGQRLQGEGKHEPGRIVSLVLFLVAKELELLQVYERSPSHCQADGIVSAVLSGQPSGFPAFGWE
jgi:hypothetical protein